MHRLGRSLLVTQNVLHLGAAGRICSSLRVRQREVSSIIPFTWARRKQELSPAVPQTVQEKTASSDPKSPHSEKRMEKFIPVTRGVLVSKLMAEDGLLNWQEKRLLENFAAALDAFFSQRFYAMLEETKVRRSVKHGMMRFNWNYTHRLLRNGVWSRETISAPPFFLWSMLSQISPS